MKKYIHIQKEDREFITKAFGVTERTVFNALRFDEKRGDTDLAKRIRKMAMERGGIEMAVVPVMETLFDADGYMRQYFPNGALLELSKEKGGTSALWYDGERVWHTDDDVVTSEIGGLQRRARALG